MQDSTNLAVYEICLIEAYYGGSHRAWADAYRRFSSHKIHLLTLPAQFWKWRMHGGAVTLSRMFREQALRPDLILATDMLDLSIFRALHSNLDVPLALYFHESQFSYPQNERQKHGWRYAFINYVSALVADAVYFNSAYHRDIFLATLPNMLKHFGDHNELQTVEDIAVKSSVLPLGVDLAHYDVYRSDKVRTDPPLILWNHRWEAEKNPNLLFDTLYRLQDDGIAFRLALVGENVRQEPNEFLDARQRLGDRVVQFGFLPDAAAYGRLLSQADYVISTARQDFFGAAVTEAIYCGCVPLLPYRLNYPALIPKSQREYCLYSGNDLYSLLKRHLLGDVQVEQAALQEHVAQFDWQRMAPIYDRRLTRLIQAHQAGPGK